MQAQTATCAPDDGGFWYSTDGGVTWLPAGVEDSPKARTISDAMLEAATGALIDALAATPVFGPAEFVQTARDVLAAGLAASTK